MEHHDERAARTERVEYLRRTVGFDAHVWLLTDPATTVGASPLADVPCLPQLPQLIRLKYLTPVNRWTALPRPVSTLRTATGDDRRRSVLWRELLSTHDVGDVASITFADQHGCWGFLDLWRLGQEARFSGRDVARLATVVEPATTLLRQSVAATFREVHASPAPDEPAALVLSPDLVVRAQTAASAAILRTLLPTESESSPVPAGAYNVAAQLLAREAGVDAHPASTRAYAGAGRWLTLRAARISDLSAGPHSDIVVTIEVSTPAERADLFTRAHALSARETELVGLLLEGADSHDIAARMFISVHTVQDHLKSVFSKCGLHSRRDLLARLAGR